MDRLLDQKFITVTLSNSFVFSGYDTRSRGPQHEAQMVDVAMQALQSDRSPEERQLAWEWETRLNDDQYESLGNVPIAWSPSKQPQILRIKVCWMISGIGNCPQWGKAKELIKQYRIPRDRARAEKARQLKAECAQAKAKEKTKSLVVKKVKVEEDEDEVIHIGSSAKKRGTRKAEDLDGKIGREAAETEDEIIVAREKKKKRKNQKDKERRKRKRQRQREEKEAASNHVKTEVNTVPEETRSSSEILEDVAPQSRKRMKLEVEGDSILKSQPTKGFLASLQFVQPMSELRLPTAEECGRYAATAQGTTYSPNSMPAQGNVKQRAIKEKGVKPKKERIPKPAVDLGKRKRKDIAKISHSDSDEEGIVKTDKRKDRIKSHVFCRALRFYCGVERQFVMTKKQQEEEKNQRPPLPRNPPVWAENRQELCETLPYYRAFQAGLYSHKRVTFGYLLDAYGAPRDVWADDGRVIISHGGGQCVKAFDRHNQPIVSLSADQSADDPRVDALLQSAKNKTPLILIAGQGYDLFPWKMREEMNYAILGWYWVSAAWVEGEYPAKGVPKGKRGYHHRFKIRFDWVDSQGEPWWLQRPISVPIKMLLANTPPGGTPTPEFEAGSQDRQSAPSSSRSTLADLSSVRQPPEIQPIDPPDILPSNNTSLNYDMKHGLLTPPTTPPDEKLKIVPTHTRFPSPETVQPIFDLDETLGWPVFYSYGVETIECDTGVMEYGHARIPGCYQLKSYAPPVESLALDNDGSDSSDAVIFHCSACKLPSQRIYREGWICVTPNCQQFWMLKTELALLPIPPGFNLAYRKEFLRSRPTPPEISAPYSVVPNRSMDKGLPDHGQGFTGSRALWAGWVCDRCGRANCRYRWEVWECRSCGNQQHHLRKEQIAKPLDLMDHYSTLLGNADIRDDSRIRTSICPLPGGKGVGMIYDLPDRIGRIYHISHRDTSLADTVFEEYQREANMTNVPLFQRRALRCVAVKGQLLSQQFAVNSGASYKYIVDTLSVPFEKSAKCINTALDMIIQTVAGVLGETIPFNEVLSVLYREGQKMSWHDDGEPGLGPVVASLSLGSTATMSWRRKTARYAPNLPFSFGKSVDSEKMLHAPACLSITLSHGDIVIMKGAKMQRKYDHRVLPHGLRVAATARSIGVKKDKSKVKEQRDQDQACNYGMS